MQVSRQVYVRRKQKTWKVSHYFREHGADAGKMEFDYAGCARDCGIPMTDTRLFPSRVCRGYFGTKRFDRGNGGARFHMLTAAALLELDFEQPSLDYHDLMKLTKILTIDDQTDVKSMFRRMCFNFFAHNRDDHSKNFTYLYNEQQDRWHLSPAYDLTYSTTYYGEHTTLVDGNGKNPGKKELLNVGCGAGLETGWCRQTMEEIQSYVEKDLRYNL